MTAEQHQVFNRLVQGAGQLRADLHDAAWVMLGVLLLIGIFALVAIGLWLLHGGLSRYSYPGSAAERKLLQEYLREP